MAIFSFFKTPKARGFEYHPRFYDPKKEEWKELLEDARKRAVKDPDGMKSRIRSVFDRNQGRFRRNKGSLREARRRSNLLLVAIILVLLALSYILLTVYLPRLIHQIEN